MGHWPLIARAVTLDDCEPSTPLRLRVGAAEERLRHTRADRHDPGNGGVDFGVVCASMPRTYEATLRSRLAVASDDNGQSNQSFCLGIQSVVVSAVGVPLFELIEHIDGVIHGGFPGENLRAW